MYGIGKRISLSLVAAASLFSMTACTSGETHTSDHLISAGLVMYNQNNTWDEAVFEVSYDEGLGCQLKAAWSGNSGSMVQPQSSMVSSLIYNGAEVLVVSPEDITAEDLKKYDVPVILFDGKVDGFTEDCYLGFDYTDAIDKSATFINDRLPATPCKVLSVVIKTDPRTKKRDRMLKDKMATLNPNVTVETLELDMFSEEDNTNRLKSAVIDKLSSDTDIAGVYANGDDILWFIYEGLANSDQSVSEAICNRVGAIVGIGGSIKANDVIKNHKLPHVEFATVECDVEIGRELTNIVNNYLNYGSLPSSAEWRTGKFIDKNNAEVSE